MPSRFSRVGLVADHKEVAFGIDGKSGNSLWGSGDVPDMGDGFCCEITLDGPNESRLKLPEDIGPIERRFWIASVDVATRYGSS